MFSLTVRCGSFSKKDIEKKHLCHSDKNYVYFYKLNVLVIDLIACKKYELAKHWINGKSHFY